MNIQVYDYVLYWAQVASFGPIPKYSITNGSMTERSPHNACGSGLRGGSCCGVVPDVFLMRPIALHCCSNDPSQGEDGGTGWLGIGLVKAFASSCIGVGVTMFNTEAVCDAGDWYAIPGIGEVTGIDNAGMDELASTHGVADMAEVAGIDELDGMAEFSGKDDAGMDGVGMDDTGIDLLDGVLRVLDPVAPGHVINQAGSLVFRQSVSTHVCLIEL